MNNKDKVGFNEIVRALRLPFITASIFPFIVGSLIEKTHFRVSAFILGLICVSFTHLGANLINDYADSKSGADWKDKRFFGFFGGSKLIQEGVLSDRFYLKLAIFCFFIALTSVILLSFILNNLTVIGYYVLILFLGFSYSHKPLQFSYHKFGELIIFILFGPAVVMGGYYIQTQIFPSLEVFLLSVPFGMFTTAILYSNEVPDYQEDMNSGKVTLVNLVGQKRAYIIYYILIILGYLSIIFNILFGNLSFLSLLVLIFMVFSIKAAMILKKFPYDKMKLIDSSKLTIAVQALVSLVLILDMLL